MASSKSKRRVSKNQKAKRRAKKKTLNKPPKPRPTEYETFLETAQFEHFLRLPAELRNRVYGHVLSGHTHILQGYFEGWKVEQGYSSRRVIVLTRHSLALLKVCRQINQETRLLPYTTCTFSFDSPCRILHWASHLSAQQRKAITSVQMRYGPWEYSYGTLWNGNPDLEKMRSLLYDALNQFQSLSRIEIKAMRPSTMLPIQDCQRSRNLHKALIAEYPGARVFVELVKVNLDDFERRRPDRAIAEESVFSVGFEG